MLGCETSKGYKEIGLGKKKGDGRIAFQNEAKGNRTDRATRGIASNDEIALGPSIGQFVNMIILLQI